MRFLDWLFNKTVIIRANRASIIVVIASDKPNIAKSILMSIPVHHSLFINNKNRNMATTFKPTGKVPFILTWLDGAQKPTLDAVTNVTGVVGDGSAATVAFDDGTFKTGFIIGKANGNGDLVFNGTNSAGQPIQSAPITLTIDDGSGTVTPNVAATIGVTLGDEVPQ